MEMLTPQEARPGIYKYSFGFYIYTREMGKYRYNRYRDLEIDISRLEFTDQESFLAIIREEFNKWAGKLAHSRERFSAVMWLNVPKSFSRVVSWLLDNPPFFQLHHANTGRIMLVKPHPAADRSSACQIPSYGTHYVKVECVVIEDVTGRVLMVKERIGGMDNDTVKCVSGSAEAGEFFADAAVREVREETGIDGRFVCLIGCGNRMRTRFDRDEIIMGCLLFAPQGQIPHADGSEVMLAGWYEPGAIAETCTPMAREWLAAANACRMDHNQRIHTKDLFRGAPHFMDCRGNRFADSGGLHG